MISIKHKSTKATLATVDAKTLFQANLEGAMLDGADFSGQDLTGICLARASCRGANFAGAKMHDANLDHTDLTGADMTGAKLDTVCDLLGAVFHEAQGVHPTHREAAKFASHPFHRRPRGP